MALTAEQLTPMIPPDRRPSSASHQVGLVELKHIGVLHYPSRGRRALTSLGLEVDEDRIKELAPSTKQASPRPTRRRWQTAHQADAPTAWLIRAGGRGEFTESFIENEIVAVGFGQLPDLSEASSRDEILELVKLDWPQSSDGQARARANQLWALLSQVRRGDVVVMPSMNNSGFALGTVTEEYWYRHDAADMRHAVSVDWKPDEVPRTAVRQDLLKALGLRPTINLIRSDDHGVVVSNNCWKQAKIPAHDPRSTFPIWSSSSTARRVTRPRIMNDKSDCERSGPRSSRQRMSHR